MYLFSLQHLEALETTDEYVENYNTNFYCQNQIHSVYYLSWIY